MLIKLRFLTLLALLPIASMYAQTIDTTFAPKFFVGASGNQVVAQADGKLLVTGNFQFVDKDTVRSFVRLLPNGDLDKTFQYAASIKENPNVIAVQQDGKIIIGGNFHNQNNQSLPNLIRLEADGRIDVTFNAFTDTTIIINDLSILPNQKIFISYYELPPPGTSGLRFGLHLLQTNGSFSSGFESIQFLPPAGFETSDLAAVGFQSNNELIVAGSNLRLDTLLQDLYRIDTTGKIDRSFNPDVISISNFIVKDLAILPDGKIGVLAGDNLNVTIFDKNGSTLASRYLDNQNTVFTAVSNNSFLIIGSKTYEVFTDGNFNTYNISLNDFILNVTQQANNRIVLTGFFTTVNNVFTTGITRIVKNEFNQFVPDPTFKSQLYNLGTINTIVVQNDQKIIVGGSFNFVNGQLVHHIARLLPNGSLDTTFNLQLTRPDRTISQIRQLSNGNLVIAGRYLASAQSDFGKLNGIISTNKDGQYLYNLGFPYFANVASDVSYLEVDTMNRLYAGEGVAFLTGAESGQILMRYDLNNPFGNTPVNYNDRFITSLHRYNGFQVQPDQKLLIYGSQIQYQNSDTACIVRAQFNGELDNNFQTDLPQNFFANDVAIVNTNQILITGSLLLSSNENSRESYIYKLQPTGVIDNRFIRGVARRLNNGFSSIGLIENLPNNRGILVSGTFDFYNDILAKNGNVVIDEAGNLLYDFLPALFIGSFNTVEILDKNTIYLGGTFQSSGGVISLARVRFSPTAVTNIDAQKIQGQLFPNPVYSNTIYLKLNTLEKGKAFSYTLYELASGKSISQGNFVTTEDSAKINLPDISVGTYVVKIKKDMEEASFIFIKI